METGASSQPREHPKSLEQSFAFTKLDQDNLLAT